jgi:hypothetical protein
MINYKIIIGELILRDAETGELIDNGKIFPISHSNILVEADDEVA